jgi:hypothetical protein
LVTDEQQAVFDYWQELCERCDGLPSREHIDPHRIKRQLPFISLYDRSADNHFHIRLAGTGFWNFYGSEISGRRIDDLPLGEGCNYWNRVLSHVSETGLPMAGSTRPHTPQGGHLCQFWLRLPLQGKTGPMVLGFDQFLRAPTREPSRLMRPVFGEGTPLLATA